MFLSRCHCEAIPRIDECGVRGHRAIAAVLNARGVRTVRRGERHATTVRNLLAREVVG